MPGRHEQVDLAQGERAGVVAEVQPAELHAERPVGQRSPARRLGARGHHGAQAQHRAEALLQVGQVAGEHVDLADERRRHQEQRDQRRRRQATPATTATPRTAVPASTAWSRVPLRRVTRASTRSTASSASWIVAARRALRRST